MKFRLFEESDFRELQSWYLDSRLNQALGPVDPDWLAAVLSETPPSQYVAIQDGQMVACFGIALPKYPLEDFVVTDIAVRPDLRRTGIGQQAIAWITRQFELKTGQDWIAYVELQNVAAQDFFSSVGWQSDGKLDESNMLKFRLGN